MSDDKKPIRRWIKGQLQIINPTPLDGPKREPELRAEVVTITPDMAKTMLATSVGNRNIRPTHVEYLARQLDKLLAEAKADAGPQRKLF